MVGSLGLWVFDKEMLWAVNHSSRLNLVLTILFAFVSVIAAQAQSSDEQSLGDVARNQREKKLAAKVIELSTMMRWFVVASLIPRSKCRSIAIQSAWQKQRR
jgi:hypothetical protein